MDGDARANSRGRIGALIGAHRAGHALEQPFYVDDDVFGLDMDVLLGRWICAGHISEVRSAGDYLVCELGRESAIVVRGRDGELRAMANVCRHRGSRICTSPRGRSALLVCPYHAWSYQLDGRLHAARQMDDDFDTSRYALKQLPVAVIGGVIFVSFTNDPPSLDKAIPAFAAFASLNGWEQAKVACRRTYTVAANWKLAVENYHECYHCAPAHPEFSMLHVLAQPKAQRAAAEQVWRDTSAETGRPRPEFEHWPASADGSEVVRLIHSLLAPGQSTGSRDGKPVAPLMPGVPAHDGGCSFAELGLLSAFLAYADHGVIYRFMPRTTLGTEMELIWLVNGHAVEGVDYRVEELVWLWDVTSLADQRIIADNQAGVASRAYTPGPYSKMEAGTSIYVARYLSELQNAWLKIRTV